MPEITVEVHEAGERLPELTEAVLRGQDVLITFFGEPVVLASLRHMPGEQPPAGLRDVVLALLEGAVNHLRDHLQPESWCLN